MMGDMTWIWRGFLLGMGTLAGWYIGACVAQHFGAAWPVWPR